MSLGTGSTALHSVQSILTAVGAGRTVATNATRLCVGIAIDRTTIIPRLTQALGCSSVLVVVSVMVGTVGGSIVLVLMGTVTTRGVMTRGDLCWQSRAPWTKHMHGTTTLMCIRDRSFRTIVSFSADTTATGRRQPVGTTKTTGRARSLPCTCTANGTPVSTVARSGTPSVLHVVVGTVTSRWTVAADVGVGRSTGTTSFGYVIFLLVPSRWAGYGRVRDGE